MAHIKRIRPDPPTPSIHGGATRQSHTVDLKKYPAVAHRQALNERLLSGLCGHDKAPHDRTFTDADARVLARIAGERFGGQQVLLRRQALVSLAQARTLPAMEALAAIAMSPLEDSAARGRALSAFAAASPLIGRALAEVLHRDAVQPLATSARKIIAPNAKVSARRKRRAPATDRG